MKPSLYALAACLMALAACDPRVEEPVPPKHDRSPASLASPSGRALAASAGPTRCIRPTPTAPTRTLSGPSPDPRCPADTAVAPPTLAMGAVAFQGGDKLRVKVEVARRDEDRQRGLMFRQAMPADQGMIFVFDGPEKNHQFWMHNTCIPLDMLFIAADGTIVGLEENVPTMDDSTFEVGCPSAYVLELNAGAARKHGIAAGQKVELELP